VERLIDYSLRLEGLARHCSTHAAGVVIAPSALTDFVPLFKGSKNEITTQYDMKMVEEIGLLKMDFLGLRTLTVIDDALKLIRKSNPDCDVDFDNMALDDPEVYQLFARGETVGVFQFESAGMRDYLRKLGPENFTDITAMNALYRPGPLDSGMIDTYIERKQGARNIRYLHPSLEKILGSTYGVIVFQEQVLKIANSLAGYSMGKADLLRKAMGKKDALLMAEQKDYGKSSQTEEFLSGAKEKKIDPKIAAEMFSQIETFARYGFNKAHSTCYAYVAYQTAWLKQYYPREFMAALMTSEMHSSDRIYTLLEECRRMDIEVLPPDVNSSQSVFTVVEGRIRYSLLAVKNVGEGPSLAIERAREVNGPFSNLADLVSSAEPGTINRRTLESLIAAGACDSLEGNRAQKSDAIEAMLEFGQKVAQQTQTHDLFADGQGSIVRVAPKLKDTPEWPNSQRLSSEKDMLGHYVSGHPLDKYRDELTHFATSVIGNLTEVPDGREVTVGGIFTAVRKMLDKKGNMMAFATLEDYTGSTELIIFSDPFGKAQDTVIQDTMALVTGRISTREGEAPKVIASEILELEKLTERFACQLVIKIDASCSDNTVDKALESLADFPGPAPVLLAARENGSEVYIRSKKYSVTADFKLLNKLKGILGETGAYLRPLSKEENVTH